MQINLGKAQGKAVRILCDSGATHVVMDSKLAKKLRVRRTPGQQYMVPGKGTVHSSSTCKVYMELPQLSPTLAVHKNLVIIDNLSDNILMGLLL